METIWRAMIMVLVGAVIIGLLAVLFDSATAKEIGRPVVDAKISMIQVDSVGSGVVFFHTDKGDVTTRESIVYDQVKDRVGQTVKIRLEWRGGLFTRMGIIPGRYEFKELVTP